MIPTTVALRDIRDCVGFVAATMQKSRIIMSDDEKEELLAEGLCILQGLSNKFDTQRDGYAQAGSFAGYAGAYLPKRLQDAWMKLHPEHHVRRAPEGGRVYEYGSPAKSLDDPDFRELPDHPVVDQDSIVDRAMTHLPAEYRFIAPGVIQRMGEGYQADEIARSLRMNRRDVTLVVEAMSSAIYEQQLLEAA